MSEPVFTRSGLGYRLTDEDSSLDIHINHIHRGRDDLSAELVIKCNLEGVKTNEGVLFVGRLNLHAAQTRKATATYLASRTPGFTMDWPGLLELITLKVIAFEAEGSPIEEVGALPDSPRRSVLFAVDPVVRKDAVTLLYGQGGSGKSALALAIAMSVASGREIVPGLQPAIKGPVIYLDWETDKETVDARLKDIADGHGIPRPRLAYRRCERPIRHDVANLASHCEENGVALVVVDSAGMATSSGGEHADASESALDLFRSLRMLGTSVLLIDHVSKSEMNISGTRSKVPYGSIYKVNLSRAAWEVRNTTEAGDEAMSLSLIHTKANDTALHETIGLSARFTETGMRYSPALVVVDQPMTLADRIADLLSDGNAMTLEDIAIEMDFSVPRCRTVMREDRRFMEDRTSDGWMLRPVRALNAR